MKRLLRLLWLPVAYLIIVGRSTAEDFRELLADCPPPWEKKR